MRTRILQGVGLATFLSLFPTVPIVHSTGRMTIGRIVWVVSLFGAIGLGGAAGGATYYGTDGLRAAGGWRKTGANVLTLLVYAFVTLLALAIQFYLVTVLPFGD